MASPMKSAFFPRISPGRLRNRSHVALRPIEPGDAAALRQAFAGLSSQTRYQRFHGAILDLSPDFLRYLTVVDGVDHVAWVALQRGAIVGVARFVRLPSSDAAEVAFVVADRLQGQGVGGLLRDRLLGEAWARGVRRFIAEVLPENHAVRRLLQSPGLELIRDSGHRLELALCPAGWGLSEQRSSA